MNKIPVRHITTSSSTAALSGAFRIRDIASLVSAQDMTQPLHRHSFFHVLVLEKGIGEQQIDFVSYTLNNHSIFFMRPGQVHQLTLQQGSKGYLLEFTGDFYAPQKKATNDVLKRVSHKTFCLSDTIRFSKLLAILSGIYEEYTQQQERYLEVIRSGLNVFFIELLRHSPNPGAAAANGNDYQQQILEQFRELLETHITAHKQVSYYSGQLHLTPYQLNAITKAALGKTSSDLINERVILEARRYLLATTDQVTRIAWHLGYEDTGYFIRFFKKHTGYTPEAFRQHFR